MDALSTNEIRAGVLQAVNAWRQGQMGVMVELLAENVVLTSPYASGQIGATVRGREGVVASMQHRRSETRLDLIDLLIGCEHAIALLRDEVGTVTWTLAFNEQGQVTKIDVAYAVGLEPDQEV